MKLYVFGNEHLAQDSMAAQVAEFIDAEIVHCRSPDDLLEAESPLVILDVVKGLKEVMEIPPEKIKTRPLVSLHDFDLGFFLGLMRELGLEKDIKIIGVPEAGDATRIAKEVEQCLKNLELV